MEEVCSSYTYSVRYPTISSYMSVHEIVGCLSVFVLIERFRYHKILCLNLKEHNFQSFCSICKQKTFYKASSTIPEIPYIFNMNISG